ncbi:MAG TPA: S41 family peptidase [Planctomycetota bacterium]|nr:S41 family peptidase [Planctomycetota bacterium]
MRTVAFPFVILVVVSALAPAQGGELTLCRHPAVSPDGSQMVFSYEGDLWVAPAAGGFAARVTSHPAREDRALWSPDGATLVFQSDRFGNVDLFRTSLVGGRPARLTFHSDPDFIAGFSADGADVLFVSRRQVTEGRAYSKLRKIPAAGGVERPVSDLAGIEHALSADGRRMAFVRGAESWWRKDYRGSANLDVWVAELPDGPIARMTSWEGNDFAPMWHPEGTGFYFLRERDRAVNVWWRPLAGEETQVTRLATPGVRFPSLNVRGTHLAFEAEDGVFVLELDPANPALPKAAPRKIPLRGFLETSLLDVEEPVTGDVTDYALSRDDKQIAAVAGGEIFVMDRKGKEPRHVRRVTDSAAGERSPCFAADSESLLFVSDASGEDQIYRASSADPSEKRLSRARKFRIEKLTDTPGSKHSLDLAPDGATLAYVRGLGDLVLADPATLADRRVLARGFAAPQFDWSPDSRWIAVASDDDDFNTDVRIFDVQAEREPYNVSRHPDEDVAPAWDPKGRFLAYAARDGLYQDYEIVTAWLRKADFEKTPLDWEDEEELRKAKKDPKGGAASRPASRSASRPESGPESAPESAPETRPESAEGAASKESRPESEKAKEKVEPVVVDFDDLHKRRRKPTSGPGSRTSPAPSPDGKSIAFVQTGVEPGLWTMEIDGKNKSKLQPAPVSSVRWAGDDLFFLSGGQVCSQKGGQKTVYAFAGTRLRRPSEERRLVFVEAWRRMRDHFYDANLHGADWAAARARFEPWAAAASTPQDLGMVVTLLLGELNASHLGFTPAARWTSPTPSRTAELGVLWDEDFPGPGLRVKRVVPGTPAAREKSRLQAGDVVLAVDEKRLDDGRNPWEAFDRLAGRDVRLTVRRGDGEIEILITPAGSIDERVYDDEVAERQARVHALTDGKVGYVHIAGMDAPELSRFEHEIFSEGYDKDCLIIDVRGNGGGWTADLLFTMLTQADHATTVPRGGGKGYPQDRRVFAAWTKPIVCLCDEFSYSNAEIFSHGVKTLKRGPVVGKTTYGAVISTGGFRLLDGSTLRNPFRGWWAKGTGLNMENHGCVPDVPVENLPQDVARGRDAQLEAAIAEALKQLK